MTFLLIIIIFLFTIVFNTEHFTQNNSDKLDNLTDSYKNYQINPSMLKLKSQKYLQFLDNVNTNLKKKAPITGAFRGSCDDRINESNQKEVLHSAYLQLDKNNNNVSNNFKRDHCVAYANELCTFTDPMLYLSENQYSPPRWLFKTYAQQDLPSYTNINCFNSNYDCCKKSM